MNLSSSVAADVALLTDALDSASSNIAETLGGLVRQLTDALPSFVGLSVLVGDLDDRVEFTTLESPSQAAQIRTSLSFPLGGAECPGHPAVAAVMLFVYAAQPGALVDLAADLTWLTGRALSEAHLDEHLGGPAGTSRGGSLLHLSVVNQALGVLIGGGLTAQQAGAELDARAATAGIGTHLVATEILASLADTEDS